MIASATLEVEDKVTVGGSLEVRGVVAASNKVTVHPAVGNADAMFVVEESNGETTYLRVGSPTTAATTLLYSAGTTADALLLESKGTTGISRGLGTQLRITVPAWRTLRLWWFVNHIHSQIPSKYTCTFAHGML